MTLRILKKERALTEKIFIPKLSGGRAEKGRKRLRKTGMSERTCSPFEGK
jgi:hypothetical protein